ncbi:DUF1254 domain-containing protein [Methylopila turkensis]|uniref:DUF1254 domain-containing protein n=1 Tax=Methylopila turkensis TaxID=1437816 RepID=A0A9W6JPV8_9HYPH|nr:DUF1254 domain-containing protein [Methylopila turkensis]GLK79669.1 DUF1254 domain-containing protein [Methylopila turkensis]
MIRLIYAVAIGLALAGLIHVASLLRVPQLAPNGAYDRLASLEADGRFVVLPDEGEAADRLPFRDPAFVTAACRYDLSQGPVTVRANLPSSYGAVVFHNRGGQPFYALSDRAATNGAVEVTVLDADAAEEAEADETVEERPNIRIASPTETGFVLVRLFAPAPSARAGLAAIAAGASCARRVSP